MQFGPLNGHPPLLAIDLREYLDGLYSYALVLSRNQAEAEDLVQETCLRALRAMERLRRDSNVKSWLFTILRNIWLNQLRQRKTAPDMVELEADERVADRAVDSSRDPHAAYVSDLEREQVRRAVERLPLESRRLGPDECFPPARVLYRTSPRGSFDNCFPDGRKGRNAHHPSTIRLSARGNGS